MLRIWGLGFWVKGLGFWMKGLRFAIKGSLRVSGHCSRIIAQLQLYISSKPSILNLPAVNRTIKTTLHLTLGIRDKHLSRELQAKAPYGDCCPGGLHYRVPHFLSGRFWIAMPQLLASTV